MEYPLISIVIPALNEIRTLPTLLDKVMKTRLSVSYEIILVDAGSSDGTRQFIEKSTELYPTVPLFLANSSGKGEAVKAGMKIAKGKIILIQDADLEYDPSDFQRVIDPILQGQTYFVLGSRSLGHKSWNFRSHETERIAMKILNLGSEFLRQFFCGLYGHEVSDPQTMYKVFVKDLIDPNSLESKHFDIDWEILCKLIRMRIYPIEVPVSYKARGFKEGKKIKLIQDGIRALIAIVKFRFKSEETFFPSSFLTESMKLKTEQG